MNTEKYESFLLLSDLLNFTSAATRLHRSQSVLSRQISALELELGFELFIRDSKQVVLTDAGRHMKSGLESLSAQYRHLLQESAEISRGMQGTLRIGIPAGEVSTINPEFLHQYAAAHPAVLLNITTYEPAMVAGMISDCTLDVVLTVNTNPWFSSIMRPEFSYLKVGVRHDLLYISAQHPLAGRDESSLSLRDFKDDIFYVLSDFEVDISNGPTFKLLKNAGFIPDFVPCASLLELMARVQSCSGICVGSNRLLLYHHPQCKKLRLRELSDHGEILLWNLNNGNPCLSPFIDALKSYLSAHPDTRTHDIL